MRPRPLFRFMHRLVAVVTVYSTHVLIGSSPPRWQSSVSRQAPPLFVLGAGSANGKHFSDAQLVRL